MNLAERSPELIAAAHALNDGRSLRKISAALAEQGFVTSKNAKPFSPSAVQSMLRTNQPPKIKRTAYGLLQPKMKRLYLTLHSLAKPRMPACADFVAVASARPFC